VKICGIQQKQDEKFGISRIISKKVINELWLVAFSENIV
jgi:hypothetical protein